MRIVIADAHPLVRQAIAPRPATVAYDSLIRCPSIVTFHRGFHQSWHPRVRLPDHPP